MTKCLYRSYARCAASPRRIVLPRTLVCPTSAEQWRICPQSVPVIGRIRQRFVAERQTALDAEARVVKRTVFHGARLTNAAYGQPFKGMPQDTMLSMQDHVIWVERGMLREAC